VAELKTRLAAATEANILGRIRAGEADSAGCVFVSEDITAVSMKNIYNVLSEKYPGYVGIFAGNDNEGYRYNAGSREKDSRELAALLRERFGAKGGGSSDMIQGRITALRSEIEGFFHDNNNNL
jgi:alanyl-tRNA synthetase